MGFFLPIPRILTLSICCPYNLSTLDRWRAQMAHQIHRSPAYLSRNQHSYCLRLKVPNDLQCYLNKKELRYSLKTGYLGVAKNRARFIGGNIQMLFKALRRGIRKRKRQYHHRCRNRGVGYVFGREEVGCDWVVTSLASLKNHTEQIPPKLSLRTHGRQGPTGG